MRTSTTYRSRRCLRSVLAAGVILALSGPAIAQAQQAAASVGAAPVADFDIPSQPLDTALTRLADQGSVRILFVSDEVAGAEAKGIAGRFTAAQALTQLLDGTRLAWRWREPGIVVVESAVGRQATGQGAVVTDPLNVGGTRRGEATGAQRDVRGYDDVYDLDISTSYIGRAEVERYKGTTPSDLLNGVAGVFSGDARNSNALDVNIRGIQGPGRVPVTIDGTEQALSVWRGYNGVSNRNYIDPFLIGGMQIIKGPAITRDVATGIGGALVVNTLDVDDILKQGETFGGEVKAEGSSNSVDPRLPTLHTGQDYRTVDGFPSTTPSIPYNDDTLRVNVKNGGGGYNVLKGEDHAYRVALGWRPADNLDLLAAYAYRERGNYYSGKHNAGYYSHERTSYIEDYISSLATRYHPGSEVTNTSSEMESWLFKATWRPTDDQALQFGYRKSLSHYGEVMPSRIADADDSGSLQWPLSRVDAQAYNLEYKWQPEDSRWIDLYANVWRTDTQSDTYSAGGFPNYASTSDPILRNTALANATNTRNGITLSNKIRFADALDLTIGGNFQHEKLRSDDEYFGVSDGWRMYPRAGRREEWNGYFNFQWRPVDFLTLEGGMRYSSYWAFDDFLKEHEGQIGAYNVEGYHVSYDTTTTRDYTQDEIDALASTQVDSYARQLARGRITQEEYDGLVSAVYRNIGTTYTSTTTTYADDWLPDRNGNYSAATNACLNGSLDDAVMDKGCLLTQFGQSVTAKAKKRKDHGWVPALSATFNLSDYSRAYFRYSEMLRYPSMFESTLAFSAALTQYDLKPEHAYNWEVAYVHDLSHFLAGDSKADVKLSYYVNKTRDVIERDNNFRFDNIDKQTIRGAELQARYDNGRFFTDLALNYQFENEVCDESTAATRNTTNGSYYLGSELLPNCVKYGFPSGYLLTMATPELSANWSLGGRFLEKRLEIGGRFNYFSQYKNTDLEWYQAHTRTGGGGTMTAVLNIPYSWGETLVMDAYLNYKINADTALEFTVNNLTDQFYIDPATRSAMAAPGRKLKLSLTYRF